MSIKRERPKPKRSPGSITLKEVRRAVKAVRKNKG